MIIGSYRADDVDRRHRLSELIYTVAGMKNADVMTIEPLTQQQAGALVKAIVKGKTAQFDRLCDFIFEKSRGNPLYILEVVKNLFHKKVLLRQGKTLVFDEKGLAQIQIPQNLQDIILQRINRLDETDIGILCDASVLGKRFATGLLIELEKIKGGSRQSVVSCLDKAHAYGILEKHTWLDKRNFSFAHDRIRDAFYKKIEGEKKTIHNSIGHLIESTCHPSNEKSDLLFDLAHHFINGENEEKILEYVYSAGLYAMERYDYDLAVRYLTIIKTILENHLGSRHDPATRAFWYQCSAKLGEAMIMTGANETGAALLISLVPFCDNPMEKAALYLQTCSAYAIRGDWRNCEQHGKAGLALLGISLPIEKNAVKCQIARDLARYFVQAFLPGILLRQRAPGKAARTRLIILFYQIIAWAMLLGDKYKFLHASLRLLWLSEKKKDDLEARCIGYRLFVTFCSKNGFWRAAEYYLHKAFALSEKSSHDLSMAQILMVKGFFYQFRGDYLKSAEFFTKGVEIFDRIGDMGSSIHCRIGLIDTHVLQGDHDRIEQLLAPYIHMAHKFGDTNGIASALLKQAQLAFEKGNLKAAEKKALECLDFSSAHNSMNNVSWIHALLGAIYLEKKITDRAIGHLCRGMEICRDKTVFGEYSVWNLPLYAQALIRKRRAGHAIALKVIKKACKVALAKTRNWKNYYGVSLRVYANYLCLAKQHRRADKMFQKSIRLLERLGRKFELALSRREYGYFLRENGRYEAAFSQLNQAWAIFDKMGSAFRNRIVNYPGPADPAGKTARGMIDARKKDLGFHPAGQLVSFGDVHTLTRYILETSMKIAGAEGGCLFLPDKKTGVLKLASKNHVAGHAHLDYSQGIVDQVLESGVAVVSVDAGSDIRLNPYRSVSLKRLKSVICMPLLYADRVSGVCYLSNQLAAGVFSTEEEMLLKTFLSAAAVHLENVRLKQSLEKREETAPDDRHPIVDGKLDSVMDFIHCRYTDNITRETIAKALNLDPAILGKQFKATMGKSLKEYVNELRLGHAYKLLLETDKKIIDVAYESGFESLRTFNRLFSSAMGDTPSNYRKHYLSNRKRTRSDTPRQDC
jgi:AraC-like DNA-binding protein/tetratricopeptide (TPR) repeat protein